LPRYPFYSGKCAVTEDRAIDILTQGAKDYVLKNRLQQRLVPAVKRALAAAEEQRARKKAEKEDLREAYSTLERQVGERTASLRKSEALTHSLFDNMMEGFTMRLAYTNGMAIESRKPGNSIPLEESPIKDVILTRTGFIHDMMSFDESVKRYSVNAKAYKEGIRSLMAVPLFSHDEVIGSLSFRSKIPKAYTEMNLSLAQRIGDQIASAIDNAQRYANLKKEEQEKSVIAEIGRIISSSLNIGEVYELFSQEVKKLIGFDRLAVSLNDLTAGLVRIAYVSQIAILGLPQGDALPLAGSLNEKVMRTKAGLILHLDSI